MNLRESWLSEATEALRPHFAASGVVMPEGLRVSCGWPAAGGLRERNRVIGQCWLPEAAADGIPQIFISPFLAEALPVLETLVHEIVHACLPAGAKHGPPFKRAAKAVGLEGKATATHAGEALRADLEGLAARLGEYPHARLDKAACGPKPQRGRQMKIVCPNEAKEHADKKYILRASRQVIDYGTPLCGVCGAQMEAAEGGPDRDPEENA